MEDEHIWILQISHRHGVNVYASRTKESADATLLRYCRENWDIEQIPDDISSVPEDEIVRTYFEHVNGEYHSIEPAVLRG